MGIASVNKKPAHEMVVYTPECQSINFSHLGKGRTAYLIGGGPSLKNINLDALRTNPGTITMAMNNVWGMYAPNMWCCVDGAGRFFDTGWKNPSIMKFTPMGNYNNQLRIKRGNGEMANSSYKVHQMPNMYFYCRNYHFNPKTFLREDTVCWGGPGKHVDAVGVKGKRSVFMASLKLLTWMGFSKIYMLGTDFSMTPENGYAFGQSRTKAAAKHNNVLYQALVKRMKKLKPELDRVGIEIRVENKDSSLCQVFKHMTFEDMLATSGKECGKHVDPDGWYNA